MIAVLVHSNVFIATAATGVAITAIVLADLRLDLVPLFIVFAAALFVYSLNRIADLEEDERNVPERAAFTRRYGWWVLVVGTGLYLLAGGFAIAWNLPRAEFLLLPPVVIALYSLFQVKQVLLVKNLLVGVSWGIIPLGVGVYYDVLWTTEILFLAGFFAVMLTAAAAVFDIKDVEGDRAQGIHTVPIAYGPQATRIGAAIVTVAAAIAVVAAVAAGPLSREFLVLLAFTGYVLAYLPFATPDRGSLFYGFVVDGEHVFLALLVLAVEWLG